MNTSTNNAVNEKGYSRPMDNIPNYSQHSAQTIHDNRENSSIDPSTVYTFVTDDDDGSYSSQVQPTNSQATHEVAIDVQTTESALLAENFIHLQTYMAFVNFSSVYSYLQWLPGWFSLRALRTFGRIQKAFWLVIVLIASVNGTVFVKDAIFRVQTENRNRPVYIILGNLSSQLALSWQFLFGLVFKSEILKGLFETMDYKVTDKNGKNAFSKVSRTAIFLNITSFLVATISCFMGLGVVSISKWSFQAVVQTHYDEIYTGFTKWREEIPMFSDNHNHILKNITTTEATTEAAPVDADHIYHRSAFASFGFISDLTIMFVVFCIGDLFVLVTCILKKEIEEMNSLIDYYNQTGGGEKPKVMCENIYHFYKCIMELSKELNKIFGTTFKLYHACNLFLNVYVLHAFVTARDLGGTIILMMKLSKGIIGYYNAVSVTEKLGPFRNFIHNGKNQKLLNIDALAYLVIKDELEEHPIGIGSGSFYINELFMRQFIIMAVTFFFILIDQAGSMRFY